MSVDKVKVGKYLCSLTEEEMDAIDLGLRVSLSLKESKDDGSDEEIRMLEDEIESLRGQLERKKDSDTSVMVERDLYKRLYEKAIDMLATDKRVAPAPALTEVTPKLEYDEPTKQEPTIVYDEPDEKAEINSCSYDDLRERGCTPTMIHHIIEHRPYKSVDELKKIAGMTRFAWQILSSKIWCDPPKKANVAEKKNVVNVNTATVAEMMEIAGLPKGLSEHIRAYRNKNGKFEKLDDLLKVDIFGPVCMTRYGAKLEV
jgi:DNA uptake protein ComE-like DNA-binding protein